MNKRELMFYNEYEEFYKMAEKSHAFYAFCKAAFGNDFSQDGFSDINQINMILPYITLRDNVHILDIGCGNGKMLGYLQEKTKSFIHGFDYLNNAIQTARKLFPKNSEFRVGLIDEIDYPDDCFDTIISMDTIYFTKDMVAFVAKIKRWLKKDGVFFVGYQEGDVMPKTNSASDTVLAKAVERNGLKYQITDITKQTYQLLKQKRKSAILYKKEFEAEQHNSWFDMLMGQTECAAELFEQFASKMARYIYVIRK